MSRRLLIISEPVQSIDRLPVVRLVHALLATLLFVGLVFSCNQAAAQKRSQQAKTSTTHSPTSKKLDTDVPPDSVPDLFKVAALGSAVLDSATPFPVPIAFLDLKDSLRYRLAVRFPHLGVLGIKEDTVDKPSFISTNGLWAYRANNPIMQLKFPEMGYAFWIDVYDRRSNALITSRLVPYMMSTERYELACYIFIHQPTTGLGSALLRRTFIPKLLPFTLETHPGWLGIESLTASGIYSLRFIDPKDSTRTFLNITINPVAFRTMDSSEWERFKDHARLAFGMKGVAVNSLGDFDVLEFAARRVIEHGYEFLSKQPDESLDYVATYMTPHAIILMMAPLERDVPADKYEFYRSIARSFRLKADADSLSRAGANR